MKNELIKKLSLASHPEGGYFREVYRSESKVSLPGSDKLQSAVTTIYFLLGKGEFSRFHRISPDEIWHFYEGDPLELFIYSEESGSIAKHLLSGDERVQVVRGGYWQAARPAGEYTLAGCTVAPGFDFEDFTFMGNAELISKVRSEYPELGYLI